jgi:UbiD family decarboxylase
MEHRIAEPASPPSAPNEHAPEANWRDLREWIALIEQNGALKRIDQPVNADEELAAITYMATRDERAPALLFETLVGDTSGSRVLTNMLGASKERSPSVSTRACRSPR